MKRIQIVSHRSGKQDRLLRHDGEPGTKVEQPHVCNVLAIDNNTSPGRLENPKEAQSETGFTRTCAAHNANLLAASDLEIDAAQDKVEVLAVTQAQLMKVNVALIWPGLGRSMRQNGRGFLLQLYSQGQRARVRTPQPSHPPGSPFQPLEELASRPAHSLIVCTYPTVLIHAFHSHNICF